MHRIAHTVNFPLKAQNHLAILIRYLTVGLLGFIFVSLTTKLLDEKLNGQTKLAYAISLLLLYLADYVLNLKYVFRSTHQKQKLTKYAFYLLISWFAGVTTFSSIFHFISNSTYANALTLLLLFPMRYLFSRRVLTSQR